ncbi:MAG TPA: DUF58 domain-containing protein [Bryobacteraceae bacterium]|jgi:uncharacterized protein (DUF58 family)|nr:DUF58 domain-containing protein [Bryobacteraceae bacterium]
MLQRFLDPAVLAGLSGLDLVAHTVVDGFIAGLHRSPDFGFSQEFAEYRAYNPGDDLRHVDWNVFARTERMYLKRYRGETNCQVTILLDASRSMKFGSHRIDKLEYTRFLAACLAYMAGLQRDAAGLIVFDDEVRNFVVPSTRQGQLARLLHAIDKVQVGVRTDYSRPFAHLRQFLHRRGLIVLLSDFWEQPEEIIKTIAPLRYHGNELVLFHVLDPEEIRPKLRDPVLLEDLESGATLEVSPDYATHEYPGKMDAHVEDLRTRAQGAGLDYFLIDTSRPLDNALREYLAIRKGRM